MQADEVIEPPSSPVYRFYDPVDSLRSSPAGHSLPSTGSYHPEDEVNDEPLAASNQWMNAPHTMHRNPYYAHRCEFCRRCWRDASFLTHCEKCNVRTCFSCGGDDFTS